MPFLTENANPYRQSILSTPLYDQVEENEHELDHRPTC
jgi:hypothetical protein